MAENEAKTPFLAHIIELRKRLVNSFIAVVIGFGFAYYYSDIIFDVLTKPLLRSLPNGQSYLVFTGVVEPFFIYLKVGFLGGVVLASPVIMYQVWAFVAPGLLAKEKKWFVSIVALSLILFICGVLFAYLLVFPFAFQYLLSFANEGLKPMLSMNEYFSMATRFLLAFGVVFQLPLAMLVLSVIGVVGGRQFLSWWRYAIVLIVIVAAILTPTPDVFNQLLMAGPLVVLYALGVVLAMIFGRKKTALKPEAKETE